MTARFEATARGARGVLEALAAVSSPAWRNADSPPRQALILGLLLIAAAARPAPGPPPPRPDVEGP